MENPINQPDPMTRHLSPSSSGKRTASPEFEFLTAATSPPLLSADELFVNGLLLPLSLLHLHPNLHQQQDHPIETKHDPSTEPCIKPDPSSSSSSTGSSKRYWKDISTIIFRKGDIIKKNNNKKKYPTTTGADNNNITASSININNILWPFSRSRSAGTGSTRPKPNPTRKVSSAPCSRSNSARKCPAGSPTRVGVHLGRASPVWQARRPKPGNNNEGSRVKRSVLGPPPVMRVLNLNVPMCIGGGGDGFVTGREGTRGGNMFNFRNIFSTAKKVV